MEFVITTATPDRFIARIKGDRRKPRLEGFGSSWQKAVSDLQSKLEKWQKESRAISSHPQASPKTPRPGDLA